MINDIEEYISIESETIRIDPGISEMRRVWSRLREKDLDNFLDSVSEYPELSRARLSLEMIKKDPSIISRIFNKMDEVGVAFSVTDMADIVDFVKENKDKPKLCMDYIFSKHESVGHLLFLNPDKVSSIRSHIVNNTPFGQKANKVKFNRYREKEKTKKRKVN